MYFDTHAHYDTERFDADRETLLAALPALGVDRVIDCGCDPASSEVAVQLTRRWDYFYAAVGTHPDAADTLTDAHLARYRALAADPKVVAIGEIGLDYHYPDGPSRAAQLDAFRRQIELAIELGKPVIAHVRDAIGDALELVAPYAGQVRGVFHCFSGSVETARELLKMGWYLGFTGVLTFKNAKKALQVVEYAPLDRLLLETDCPYMAPEPYRGRRCDSSMLERTCAAMARAKELPPEEVAARTAANASRLFGVPASPQGEA